MKCFMCAELDEEIEALNEKLLAADALAKAAREAKTGLENLYRAHWAPQFPKGKGPIPSDDLVQRNLTDALAAYEKVRETRSDQR